MLYTTYDLNLVLLSIIIAILSAYTALDLAERITTTQKQASLAWLIAGASSLGIGIWSMHFVGMLAFNLPVSVSYDIWIMGASVLPAILASGLALFLASRAVLPLYHLLGTSLLMGAGISTMHYLGMAAMRLPAIAHYNWQLVTLSVAIAITVSFIALWLIHFLQNQPIVTWWQKIGAAILMGLAISSMHYTGMMAVCFMPTALPPGDAIAANTTWLASLVSALAISRRRCPRNQQSSYLY